MYRPAHFDITDVGDLHDLVEASGPAHLVTAGPGGLDASVVPMLLDRTAGPLGTLRGHVARANPQWRAAPVTALAILPGPDAYVTPSWYVEKAASGKVVPTWDYVVVHAAGELVAHQDPAWIESVVRGLTDRHERGRPQPWSVDDAPAPYVASMLKAIVGIELRITRLEGKRKLSQNRAADLATIADGLGHGTPREREVARAIRHLRRPSRERGTRSEQALGGAASS